LTNDLASNKITITGLKPTNISTLRVLILSKYVETDTSQKNLF